MRISRIFFPHILNTHKSITLPPEASHYLIRVLRHKLKHKVVLFNNSDGYEYLTTIIDANPKAACLAIDTLTQKQNESPINIHLFQALSKGDKLETVIQKATELGVNSITPIFTQYVDYKLPTERLENKLDHWQKIAISASEQSGRVFVPQINPPLELIEALKMEADVKLFLTPHSTSSISQLHQQFPGAHHFVIYIGPEGGFSEAEEKLALDNHCHNICLGTRVLRTETAPLAILSVLQAFWGDY